MKYSTYIYLLLAMMIIASLTSCSDDNFIETDVDIQQSDPDTLDYTYVTGLVKDIDGNLLPNIEVEYLIDGKLNTTSTNAQGAYEIREFQESVTRASVKCQGGGYLPKMEIIHINEMQVVENDIILVHEGQLGGGPSGEFIVQSLTDSLFSVSGRLINDEGDGVSGVNVYIVDLSFTTFIYAVTDADGNFTFATETLDKVFLLAGSQCQSVEILIDEFVVDKDLELGDLTTFIIEGTFVTFTGFITDCYTQEGLINGDIQFSFDNEVDIITGSITNGAYAVEIPLCTNNNCVDITIYSYFAQTGVDTLLCQPFTLTENDLDYEVCNTSSPVENEGTLTHIINGVSTTYPLAEVQEEITNYVIAATDASTSRAFLFITESKATFGNTQTAGILDLATGNALYTSLPGEMTYQIDSISTEFMYGSFEGLIINGSTGSNETIDGTFKAVFNQ